MKAGIFTQPAVIERLLGIENLDTGRRRSEHRYAVHEFAMLRSGAGTYAVTILDVSKSGLSVSLPAPLEAGESVEVRRRDGTVLACEVRYCQQRERETHHAGLQILAVPAERRREKRFPINEKADLVLLNGSNPDKTTVLVRDISKNGIGFNSERQLTRGDAVEVRLGTVVVFATVQYSRPLQDGTFLLGCRIADVVHSKGSLTSAQAV